MSTFQAIVYGIIHGFTEFLPVSSSAHQSLVPFLLGWQAPNGPLFGAFAIGTFAALMVYFRHDWASMISCFIQVILFRKRPMTLDERLPIFLTISSLPLALGWYYFHETVQEWQANPLLLSASLALISFPLWFTDSMSRKNKGMFDWTWLDAGVVGLTQLLMLVPGGGHIEGVVLGGAILNYRREAAAKYAYFASAPILLASMIVHLKETDFHSLQPMPETSWLSYWIAVVVALFAGLLAIGGFTKHVQRRGLGQYMAYRFVLGIGVAVAYWLKNRH